MEKKNGIAGLAWCKMDFFKKKLVVIFNSSVKGQLHKVILTSLTLMALVNTSDSDPFLKGQKRSFPK